jgi:hypothetical protein
MKAKWEYNFQFVPNDAKAIELHTEHMQSEGWEMLSAAIASSSDFGMLAGLTNPKSLLITWKRPNGN